MEGTGNVYAVGDVAAWRHPTVGDRPRIEHWTSATEQAAVVAQRIAGTEITRQADVVPYFWSDQYGLKIQLLGRPERADTVLPLHGEADGGPVRGTVAGYLADDRLVAVVGFGAARWRGPLPRAHRRRRDPHRHPGPRRHPVTPAAPPRRNDHGQRNILRSTARAIRLPTAISPSRIRGSAQPGLHALPAGVREPARAGPIAQHVEALGEGGPGLLDLALDGVRVARHSDSLSSGRSSVPP